MRVGVFIQRASFARDSRFRFCSVPMRRLCKALLQGRMKVRILVQRAPRAIRDSAAALWWRRGFVTSLASSLLLLPLSAHAWGTDGHKIVAVIAADNLTPAAATHVATILGAPADKRSVAAAMEAAAILPDTEFRDQDRRTAPWHFIDLCLQDQRSDISNRC